MAISQNRERIIRAAWEERGKAQWDPNTHGRGLLSLHIPAKVEMRPVRFGTPLPSYDDLEFRLVQATMNGRPVNSIVCEGVVVETLDGAMSAGAQLAAQDQATPTVTFASGEAATVWLARQSDDVAVVFAARAALRVLPTITFSNWPGTRRETTRDTMLRVLLRVFRAVATAWAVAAYPSHRTILNDAARSALSGLGDIKAPFAIRAAAYASATATGEADAVSRASTVIGCALDAAASRGFEAFKLLLEALAADASLLDQRFSTVTLANSQLWPRQIPDWVRASWDELRFTLIDADENWEVWIDWYEERLAGENKSPDVEIARVGIDDSIWRQEPSAVNAYIRRVLEEYGIFYDKLADEPQNTPDTEPSSGPGPQYRPRGGKLSEVASVPSDGEAAQQLGLHRLVQRDAKALAESLQRAANRYPELAIAAGEYSSLLGVEIIDVDVTAIWSVGGSLASFAQSYREQNAARTLAEPLEPQLDALLQSVVRQHGAFIMGFQEGRDLVNRADEFILDAATLRQIEEPGTALLNELTNNRDLVDDRTRGLHRPIRDSAAEFGWTTSRVGYSAYLIVRNGVRAMVKYTVGENPNATAIFGLIAATSVIAGDPNAEFVRAAVPVLQQFASQLLAFFNNSPEMRGYVGWALRILGIDHNGSGGQQA
jgi:hypothetical protein